MYDTVVIKSPEIDPETVQNNDVLGSMKVDLRANYFTGLRLANSKDLTTIGSE